MNIKKATIILLLIAACVAGVAVGTRQQWVYPLPEGTRFRLIPSTDPNNWWDDANDVYTINGRLDVYDVNVAEVKSLVINERSSDPSKPGEGTCIFWMSDGTEFGDDGDVCIASTAGGVTTRIVLYDKSAGAVW